MSDTITQVITDSIQDAGLADSPDTPALDATDTSTDDAAPDLEGSPSPTDSDAETPTDTLPAPAKEPDALLQEFARKRNNRIPYSRVEKIVAKAREEAKTAALAEANAIREQYRQYESPEFLGLMESLRVAQDNPERFLEALAQADHRYAELLAAKREAQAAAASSQQDSIAPDVQLPDGSVGYSPEAFDRLLASRIKAAETALERRFAERFGPIEASFNQAQLYRGAVDRVKRQIAEAETWPGFAEHKADITAAVQADRSLSLEQAYRKVVLPKFAASRDEIRKQVLAEINAKSKASQSRPSSAGAPVTNGPRDTEDIIKQAIRDKGLL